MNYKIIAIASCKFKFEHRPKGFLAKPEEGISGSVITMELVSDKIVPPIFLYFLEATAEKVVMENTTTQIVIHLPISSFNGFYSFLHDALGGNRYTVNLTIDSKSGWSFANFDFIVGQ